MPEKRHAGRHRNEQTRRSAPHRHDAPARSASGQPAVIGRVGGQSESPVQRPLHVRGRCPGDGALWVSALARPSTPAVYPQPPCSSLSTGQPRRRLPGAGWICTVGPHPSVTGSPGGRGPSALQCEELPGAGLTLPEQRSASSDHHLRCVLSLLSCQAGWLHF